MCCLPKQVAISRIITYNHAESESRSPVHRAMQFVGLPSPLPKSH